MRIINLTSLGLALLVTILIFSCKTKQLLKPDNLPTNPPILDEPSNDLSETNDESNNSSIIGYDLIGNLYVENLEDSLKQISTPNLYNNDNKIYKSYRQFIFQYSILEENIPKKTFNFLINNGRGKLKNVPNCFVDDEGNKRGSYYHFQPYEGNKATFLTNCFVENKHNVLFPFSLKKNSYSLNHIPASNSAEIDKNIETEKIIKEYCNKLPFAPYPFIKLNQIEGAEWSYQTSHTIKDTKVSLDKSYKRKNPKHYNIVSTYNHQGSVILDTPFGKIPCKKVTASSTKTKTSGTGKASDGYKLTSYFHPEYGFVKLEYDLDCTNLFVIDLLEIDDSKLAKK